MTEPLTITRAKVESIQTQNASRDWTGRGKSTYTVFLELSRPLTRTERDMFLNTRAPSAELIEVPDQGSTVILHGTTIEDVRDNRAQLSALVQAVADSCAKSDAEAAANLAARKAAEQTEIDRRRSIADSIEFD